jgi:hypothetical protein
LEPRRIKEEIRGYYCDLNARNISGAMSRFSPDLTWQYPPLPVAYGLDSFQNTLEQDLELLDAFLMDVEEVVFFFNSFSPFSFFQFTADNFDGFSSILFD